MKTRLKKDMLIVISILLIPFLAYVADLFPAKESINIIGFQLSSGHFVDIETMVWVWVQKLMFVLIFAIWYLSCKFWWKNILLIPLTLFVFQLVGAIQDSFSLDTKDEFFYIALITLPIVASFVLLTKKISIYLESKQSKEELELEIEQMFLQLSSDKLKCYKKQINRLKELKALRGNLNQERYLKELYKLKQEFTD